MCDTFVVLPEPGENGRMIFGKNSDREPNEAQEVVMLPAMDYPSGSEVRCTYRSIPQVLHTHAVLLMKPFWMWGAEMGANECGVVIGNEAVFTRAKMDKGEGLIGMDYLRLALERAGSADEALEVMTDLLALYGQGGNCGFTHPFYYHNSFIIADAAGAWVLETAGQEWAAEKVTGVRSISNAITIGAEWTKCSPRLVETAVERGWCKNRSDFNFSRDYSEPVYTTFSAARQRQACTTRLLRGKPGGVKVEDAFAVLRAHMPEDEANFRPDPGLTGADVCMHAGWGPVRNSQSVGSLVAEVGPTGQTFWVTGTSAPCTGVFKPVWFAGGIPWSAEPAPAGTFDANCLWWRHEQLHRRIIRNYPDLIPLIKADQRRLEAEALDAAADAEGQHADLAAVSADCFHKAEAVEKKWLEAVRAKTADRIRFYYRMAWDGFNRQANLTLEN